MKIFWSKYDGKYQFIEIYWTNLKRVTHFSGQRNLFSNLVFNQFVLKPKVVSSGVLCDSSTIYCSPKYQSLWSLWLTCHFCENVKIRQGTDFVKFCFPWRISSYMWPNRLESTDLDIFTEEILNRKLNFCAVLPLHFFIAIVTIWGKIFGNEPSKTCWNTPLKNEI